MSVSGNVSGSRSGSRHRVLAGIRASLAVAGDSERTIEQTECVPIGPLSSAARRRLFLERLQEYGAGIFHAEADALPAVIAEVLQTGGRCRVIAPAGLPAAWLGGTVEWIADQQLAYEAIEAADGVLTTATAAVAESGTLLLSHDDGQGRRALTLLPDYHLCVVYASQIAATLPECFARIAPMHTRPLTFISGPSATADIEMTRIKGVHGPRFLDVILVEDEL